ncbi:MAG TPA: hypothetical protein VEI03_13585 [Stellaceae bacterium]|nr:hypothetical protein [Stellaceae bacterium]
MFPLSGTARSGDNSRRPMTAEDKYLVLLRRELTRAQARLKRAERERDEALEENRKLRQLLRRRRARAPRKLNP